MSMARFSRPLLVALTISLYAWLTASPADAIAQRNWIGSLTGTRLFSTAGNWDGSTPIATGDYLTFGSMVNFSGDLQNDLTGYSATRLTFTGSYGFVMKGNPLTVSESIIVNKDGGEHSIELNIGGKAETLVAANSRLHLSGANTFTGQVDVYGDLYADSNSALGSIAGPTKVEPGGSLRIDGRDLAEPIRVSAADSGEYQTCAIQNGNGTSVIRDIQVSGKTCILAGGELNFPNGIGQTTPNVDLLLAYGITRVGGTSPGSGTIRLAATNLYWNSSSALDIVAAPIAGGPPASDLYGSGSAASLDFTDGTFAPGSDSGPGRFSLTGAFTIHDATLALGLNGTTAGTGHSAVQTGGPVTIGSETELQLLLYVGYTPTVGSQYRIIDNTGTQPISGTFAGLPEGAQFFASGRPWSITYKGGSGNDVVVTALQPDPRPFRRFVPLVAAGN